MLGAIDPEFNVADTKLVEECCAGLVQLDRHSCVQLFHSSARDLLNSDRFQPQPGTTLGELLTLQERSNEVLVTTCLENLLLPAFRSGPASSEVEYRARMESHPFHLYASQYWAHHLRESPGNRNLEMLPKFLQSSPTIDAYLQSVYASGNISNWDEYPRERTALHVVARFGLLEALEYIPTARTIAKTRDSKGWKPLDLALRHGHRDMCMALLQHETFVNERNMNVWPLHRAVEHEWPDIVDRLLHMRANLDLRNFSNHTPLHTACRDCENDEILRLLLDAGSELEAQATKQATPLMLAAEAGNVKAVKILIDAGANINAVDGMGRTPLHYAARCNRPAVVELLIQAGLPVDILCAAGDTPLHVAAMSGQKETAMSLIEKGCPVNAVNVVGATALHVAIAWGFEKFALALIQRGADALTADVFYWNAIHILAFMRKLDMLARFQPPLLPAEDMEGNTDIVSRLFQSLQARNSIGNTLLWTSGSEAFFYVCIDNVRRLVECLETGTSVNTADRHGVSLLHAAVAANSSDIVAALIDNGADVNCEDMWGRRPYELAVGRSGEAARNHIKQSGRLQERPAVDPATLEVKNCWVMQHIDRNFVLYVRCNECGSCIDGLYLHIKETGPLEAMSTESLAAFRKHQADELKQLAEKHMEHDLQPSDLTALHSASRTLTLHATLGSLLGLSLGAYLAFRLRSQRQLMYRAFRAREKPTHVKFADGREGL
ncbi:MAG: hypothetical protein Q9227_002779 [Pyrenula ochraceoflavens]